MTLSDIIGRVIQILGLEDEVSLAVPSAKLNKLIDCANMMIGELTQEYIHLKTTESISFCDGRAYYKDFGRQVREVLAVKESKAKRHFVMYPLYLYADGLEGAAEVTYLYHLGTLGLADAVELPPQYSVHTLAVGVAAEYCYRIGLVDEALFYKNRYDNSLINLSKRMRTANLPIGRII